MPEGWTSRARRAASIVVLVLALLPWDALRHAATGAEVRLPFQTFFDLHVDEPRRHVFVSGGLGTGAVLVFGYDGRLIRRIRGLAGASGMTADGDRLYVALADDAAIAVVDLETLKAVDTISVAPHVEPTHVSKSGDTIFFSFGCSDPAAGSFGSVDLATRFALEHDVPNPGEGACVEHAVSPADPVTMLVWGDQGSETIARYAVTGRRPVEVAESEPAYFENVTFSADGETFYTSRAPYYGGTDGIEARRVADFSVTRTYRRGGYSFAVTPDGSHVFSSGNPYRDDDLVVYRDGVPPAHTSLDDSEHYDTDSILPGALGASAAGDRVFAVVERSYHYPTLEFRVVWPQYTVAGGGGDQMTPASGGGFEVWTHRPSRRAPVSPLLAREGDGTFRVTPRGASGYAGSIENGRLVYQQVRRGRSDLFTYDLERRRRVSRLARPSTRGWEWHPTTSGGRVLFGRFVRGRSRVILSAPGGGRERVLADVGSRNQIAIPGQVNGRYAVWTVCRPECDVYRLDLRTGRRTSMPRPSRRENYAASVTDDGAVYYAQSGAACGSNVELYRRQGGRVTQIEDLAGGEDLFTTYADDGADRVLFDRVRCRGMAWDVISFRDAARPGDARGAKPEQDEGAGGAPAPGRGTWFEDVLPGAPS